MESFVGQRQRNADEIGFGQQGIQVTAAGIKTLLCFFMSAAGVIQHRHAEAEMSALRQRQTNTTHAEDADSFVVHVNAKPVCPDAALPFAGLHSIGHFYHATSCRQNQAHDGVGDGFSQHGWGVHQQHVMGIKRVNVEIIVTDGNG